LFYSSLSSGTPVFLSPITLPNDVTLKLLDIGFVDNSSSNLEACLIKIQKHTTDLIDVFCMTSSINSASATTVVSAFPANTIIDNITNQYFFRLRILNGSTISAWPGNTIKFNRANFTFSY